jgi:hypothetical protein
MIQNYDFIIFTSKEDWQEHYDEKWNRLNNCSFSGGEPTNFPIAYQRFEDWDPRCCDHLGIVSIEKAKQEIKKGFEEQIKNLQKTIDKLEEM